MGGYGRFLQEQMEKLNEGTKDPSWDAQRQTLYVARNEQHAGRQEREGFCSPLAFSLLPANPLQVAPEFSTSHISIGHSPPGISPWTSSENSSPTIQCQRTFMLCTHPFHPLHLQPPSNHPHSTPLTCLSTFTRAVPSPPSGMWFPPSPA